jgi:hypothetical protein
MIFCYEFDVNPNYRACTAAVDNEPRRTRTVRIGFRSAEGGFLAPVQRGKGLRAMDNGVNEK